MSELSELFRKDPLEWIDAEVEMAVAYYKEHRNKFALIKKDGQLKRVRTKKAKTKQVDPNQIEELIKEMSP
jgi:hypothetical protein